MGLPSSLWLVSNMDLEILGSKSRCLRSQNVHANAQTIRRTYSITIQLSGSANLGLILPFPGLRRGMLVSLASRIVRAARSWNRCGSKFRFATVVSVQVRTSQLSCLL